MMPTFQWYSRSDLGFLIKFPLIFAAIFMGSSLLDVNPFLGSAVIVLGFFVADWLGSRLIASICPETPVPDGSRSPDNGDD